MSSTLNYYDRMATEFVQSTLSVDFHATQDLFLSYLSEGAYILDFGCGSGRDTKYFLDRGYRAMPVDGSDEMCRVATALTGVPAEKMYFEELNATDEYDGIWACASILHLEKEKLPQIFQKMADALKECGILYVSFKYGSFEGYRGERYFTDLNENSLMTLVSPLHELQFMELWVSSDVRPGRGDEKWINAILKKEH